MTDVLPATMKCPHCLVSLHVPDYSRRSQYVGIGVAGHWWTASVQCPSCHEIIIWLVVSEGNHLLPGRGHYPTGALQLTMVYPKSVRSPASSPGSFAGVRQGLLGGLPCPR